MKGPGVDARNGAWDPESQFALLRKRLAGKARQLGASDPEAAAQETFLRALGNATAAEAIHYYYGPSLPAEAAEPQWSLPRLIAWLFQALVFVTSEQRRTGKKGFPAEEVELVDSQPDSLTALILQEQEQALDRCLQCLRDEERQALLLRIAGQGYAEIARKFGIPENTIASRISRGRERLRECLRRTILRDRTRGKAGVLNG